MQIVRPSTHTTKPPQLPSSLFHKFRQSSHISTQAPHHTVHSIFTPIQLTRGCPMSGHPPPKAHLETWFWASEIEKFSFVVWALSAPQEGNASSFGNVRCTRLIKFVCFLCECYVDTDWSLLQPWRYFTARVLIDIAVPLKMKHEQIQKNKNTITNQSVLQGGSGRSERHCDIGLL